MTLKPINRPCLLIAMVGCLILSGKMESAGFASPGKTIIGIQLLQDLKGAPVHSIVPAETRPLFTASELETYLRELERHPPSWDQLSSDDMSEQSQRLFQYNRQRDQIREEQAQLLQYPIAFLWGGELRHFSEEYQGYTVALGPEIIHTSWGLVRFKPRDIPNNMIARIPNEMRAELLHKPDNQVPQEIGVLFIGTLTESESIMYAFSHDGDHAGMILPVVNITALKYYLK